MTRVQRSEYCDEVMRDNRRAVNRLAVEYACIERAANVVLEDIERRQRELSAEARRSRDKSKAASCWCYVKAARVAVAFGHLRGVGGANVVNERLVATTAVDAGSLERQFAATAAAAATGGDSRGAAAAAAGAGLAVLCSLHTRTAAAAAIAATAAADGRREERRMRLPPLRGALKQAGSDVGVPPKDETRARSGRRTSAPLPSIVAAAASPARSR